MKQLMLAILFVVVHGAAAAAPAGFASAPTAKRDGGTVTVSFALSAPNDVAVYVLDAKGKCVRHLAAGMLGGEKPPPAPFKAELVQSLTWDGKDDYGRTAEGGPFKVRVCLGLEPEFDRMIGHKPACVTGGMSMNRIGGLGVGPDGTVYVLTTLSGFGTGSSHASIKAFDRDGVYLRMVAPYPANLPEDKLKGIKRIDVSPGRPVPFVYNAETRALVPGLGENGLHRMVVTSDSRLVFRGSRGINRNRDGYSQLVALNTDGSIPSDGLLGPKSGGCLAVSLDGKTLFAATGSGVHAVVWGEDKSRRVVSAKLAAPSSLAIDADGNFYVAESKAGRVSVFKPDGSKLGEIQASGAAGIAVHPKTGAVYIAGGKKCTSLWKYDSWKHPKPSATGALPKASGRPAWYTLALDVSGQTPALWAACPKSILRLEDRGTQIKKAGGIKDNGSSAKATDLFVLDGKLHVYSQRGYWGPAVYDALSGKAVRQKTPKKAPYVGYIIQGGADGKYYTLNSGGKLARFDNRAKALPFSAADKGIVTGLGHTRTRARGMDIDGLGNIYVLRQKLQPEKAGDANSVAKFGPDGQAIDKNLVDSDIRNLNSVRVDPAGNVYLALGVRPDGKMVPPCLDGRVPDSRQDPDADSGHNYYPLMYGMIAKFGPGGGHVRRKGEGLAAIYAWDKKVFVKGAEWIFFGASLVPVFTHGGMKPDICACESPRFDVDKFGRSFFGDACGFRVGVLDSAGNLIRWFGDYGNQDSAGPGSAISTPDIPIGWVHAVAVDEYAGACFIGDRLNQRVVRVKLGYEAEQICTIE